jgi:hypothetical protein
MNKNHLYPQCTAVAYLLLCWILIPNMLSKINYVDSFILGIFGAISCILTYYILCFFAEK